MALVGSGRRGFDSKAVLTQFKLPSPTHGNSYEFVHSGDQGGGTPPQSAYRYFCEFAICP